MSLLGSCATTRVETLADIQRHFNALFGTTVAYKPFHNQLAKRQFADFMRELVAMLIERWAVRVLEASGDGAFSEFGRIVIQDGSSFAVHDALAEHYPGRFRARCPAAVELHVTMDLLQDRAAKVTLTADTAPERPSGTIAGTRRIKTAPRQKSPGLDPGRVVSAYAMRSLSCRMLRDARVQELEEPTMTNPKPEEPVRRPPTEVDDDWFTRIQRAKAAREQGQKAREGNPPVDPIPRMPLSPRHD